MTAPGELTVEEGPLPDFDPVRRSPVHRRHLALSALLRREGAWEIPVEYGEGQGEREALREGLAVVDVTARAKIDLRGSLRTAATLGPLQPGRVARLSGAPASFAAAITDGWAVLLGPPAEEQALLSLAERHAETGLMVTDVGSLFAGFALAGPRTPELLARLIGIDPGRLEVDTCAATSVARVWALIVRPNAAVVEIYAGCEYGRYLWETMLAVGRPLGIRPVGWQALRDEGWS